jgi:hypothetical protein
MMVNENGRLSFAERKCVEIFLHCHERVDLGAGGGLGRLIDVVDRFGNHVDRFDMMCAAIDSDIRSAEILDWIEKIESGEETSVEGDGNGWVVFLNRKKVCLRVFMDRGRAGLFHSRNSNSQ